MGLQMPVGKLTLAWLLLLLGMGVAYADERMLAGVPGLPYIPIDDPVARFQYMAALSYGRTQVPHAAPAAPKQPVKQEDDSSRRTAPLPFFYVLSSKVFPDKHLKEAGLFAKRVPYEHARQPNPDFEYRPPCDCPHCHPPGGGQYPPGGGYPPNSGYPPNGGYPPTGGYPSEGGYPPNGGYPQEGYPPNGYPPNNGGYPDNNYQPGYPQGGGRPPGGVRPNPPLGPDGYPLRPGYPDDTYPQKPQRPTRPSGSDQQRPQNEPVHEKPNRPRPTKPSRPQDTLFKPVSSYPQAQYPSGQYPPQQSQYPQNSQNLQHPQQYPYAPQYQPPRRSPVIPEFYPEKKPLKPGKFPGFYGPQYPYGAFPPPGFHPVGFGPSSGPYPSQVLGVVPALPYPPPIKPPKQSPTQKPVPAAPIFAAEQKPAKQPEDQTKPTATQEPEHQMEEQPDDEQKPELIPEEEPMENTEEVEDGPPQEEEASAMPQEEEQEDAKVEEEQSAEPEAAVSTDEEAVSPSEATPEEPQEDVDEQEQVLNPEDEKAVMAPPVDASSNPDMTKKIQISKNPDLYISPDDAAFLKHIGELKRFQDKLEGEKGAVAREGVVEGDEIPRVDHELRSAVPYGDVSPSRYAPLYNPAQYGDGDDGYWGGYYGGAY